MIHCVYVCMCGVCVVRFERLQKSLATAQAKRMATLEAAAPPSPGTAAAAAGVDAVRLCMCVCGTFVNVCVWQWCMCVLQWVSGW